MKTKRIVLGVFGKDRAGIVADVTRVLFELSANLEDASMTNLESEFSMMLIVKLRRPSDESKLRTALKKLEKKSGVSCFYKTLTRSVKRGEHHAAGAKSYLITAIGPDQTGIVYHVSRLLAKRKLSITDLNSRILGTEKRPVYALMLEVDLPKQASLKGLASDLRQLQKKLRVEVELKPVERLEL